MKTSKEIIEDLYPINAHLLGEGYDKRLEYLKNLFWLKKEIPPTYATKEMKVLEFPTGTEFDTWTVPEEWIIKEAWIKYKGEKILDYEKEPLSVLIYSTSFKGNLSKEELIKNIYSGTDFGDNDPDTIPYRTSFYEKRWGFCMSENQKKELPEGDYEVFIDSEFKNGVMKLGVLEKPGKTDREILLFAHLDHPYQANDNLSGVACILEVLDKIECEHTIKIVFCPETIGSIAYALTQDLSKVDFMIAVDICGNDNSVLSFKTWNPRDRINYIVQSTLQMSGKTYRKAPFRSTIGSDETVFNDPLIGIPGLLFSTFPYKEYHTSADTPDKISYEKITEVADLIIKVVELYEKDFIPIKNFKGPLMRSKYGMQTVSKQVNLNYDYFFYMMDGKKSLLELCADLQLPFDIVYDQIKKIEADGKILRADVGKGGEQKTSREKSSSISRTSNVRGKSKKVLKDI